MDRERTAAADTTVDVTDASSSAPAGKHRRVIDLTSHEDLLAAFDADERLMEALLSSLPPVPDETTGRHHRAG